jgi:hypothetical protein
MPVISAFFISILRFSLSIGSRQIIVGRLIRSRQLAHPSGFPSMSLNSPFGSIL